MHRQYALLSAVKDRIAVGHPQPSNVYQQDFSLLLARGQILTGLAELQALTRSPGGIVGSG